MIGTPSARLYAGRLQDEEEVGEAALDFSEAENSQYVAVLEDN
jgi:hypothetical protein